VDQINFAMMLFMYGSFYYKGNWHWNFV